MVGCTILTTPAATMVAATNREAAMTSKSKHKGVYFRDGIAYIRYQDERGRDVRESTKQRSVRAALDILAKRKTEVAMHEHFPTRAFDAVSFSDLAAYWWDARGSKTRSQFHYLYPRVLEHFAGQRARDVTPDAVDAFLNHLADTRKLSASSVNHHRTILNGIFNFAITRGRFDKNPVAAVRQRQEPPGRDRFVTPDEFRALWDRAAGDLQMRAFLAFAGTTTMRKGEILSLRWENIHLSEPASVKLVRTKTGHQRHVPLPTAVVEAIERLPSRATSEYVFPSGPTARCPEPERPYRWDYGKEFRALAKAANVKDIRIHDLRHAGATILMTLGVPDPIVRKLTGHRSRELERYQHLTPELRARTVNLIAAELFRVKQSRKETGTPTGTVRKTRAGRNGPRRELSRSQGVSGGVDGARTRGLRRDRPAF
jgi:integrase